MRTDAKGGPPPNADVDAPGIQDFDVGTSAATSAVHVKIQLIRKVYALLLVTLAVTAGITCVFVFVDPVSEWIVRNSWMVWVGLGIVIVAYVMLFCVRKAHPWNAIGLGLLTLGFSVLAGSVAAAYNSAGYGYIVLQALLATTAVFVALTLVCFLSKKDFSFLGAFLGAALLVLLVVSLFTFWFGWAAGGRSKW